MSSGLILDETGHFFESKRSLKCDFWHMERTPVAPCRCATLPKHQRIWSARKMCRMACSVPVSQEANLAMGVDGLGHWQADTKYANNQSMTSGCLIRSSLKVDIVIRKILVDIDNSVIVLRLWFLRGGLPTWPNNCISHLCMAQWAALFDIVSTDKLNEGCSGDYKWCGEVDRQHNVTMLQPKWQKRDQNCSFKNVLPHNKQEGLNLIVKKKLHNRVFIPGIILGVLNVENAIVVVGRIKMVWWPHLNYSDLYETQPNQNHNNITHKQSYHCTRFIVRKTFFIYLLPIHQGNLWYNNLLSREEEKLDDVAFAFYWITKSTHLWVVCILETV